MTFDPRAMMNYAKSWVGFHEGAQNRNPFTLWQTGFTATQPWCDSFVCNCAYQGGGYRFPSYSLFGAKGDWNVGSHHQHAIEDGIFRARDSYVAQPGDLVILNFDQPDQHIEIVDTDLGPGRFPRLATVGGNTNDMVAFRSRYEGNIGGFIALTQDRTQHPDPTPIPPEPPKPRPPRKVKDVYFFFRCSDAATEDGRKVVYVSDGVYYQPTIMEQLSAMQFIAGSQGYSTGIGSLTKKQIGHMVRVEDPILH